MTEPVPAAAAAAGPAQTSAAAGPTGAAMMRLQKLVKFAGLTVELFEDMQEVWRGPFRVLQVLLHA